MTTAWHGSLEFPPLLGNALPDVNPAEQPCRWVYKGYLGQGTFGLTYLVYEPRTGREAAVKLIHLRLPPSDPDRVPSGIESSANMRSGAGGSEGQRALLRDLADREMENMAMVESHCAFPSLYDYAYKGEFGLIFMEYCDLGDLSRYISRCKKSKQELLSEDEIKITFVQILVALLHLHNRRMIHRDLKSANVLITSRGLVKLADFGLASVNRKPMTSCGTPEYMAPEQWATPDDGYTSKVDMWAAGVLLYEMMAQQRPFDRSKGDVRLREQVLKAQYKPLHSVHGVKRAYSKELRETVAMLLQPKADDRPSASQLLRTPYFVKALQEFVNGLAIGYQKGSVPGTEVHMYYHCLWADGLLAGARPEPPKSQPNFGPSQWYNASQPNSPGAAAPIPAPTQSHPGDRSGARVSFNEKLHVDTPLQQQTQATPGALDSPHLNTSDATTPLSPAVSAAHVNVAVDPSMSSNGTPLTGGKQPASQGGGHPPLALPQMRSGDDGVESDIAHSVDAVQAIEEAAQRAIGDLPRGYVTRPSNAGSTSASPAPANIAADYVHDSLPTFTPFLEKQRESRDRRMANLMRFIESQERRERANAIIDPFFDGLKLLKMSLNIVLGRGPRRSAPFRLGPSPVPSRGGSGHASGAPARAATVLARMDNEERRARDAAAGTPQPRASADTDHAGQSRLGQRLRAARQADTEFAGETVGAAQTSPGHHSAGHQPNTDTQGAALSGAPVRRLRDLHLAFHGPTE
uniref:non-specific serine/threonine protein kinase n=1 Tax=Neobodo designis TaxID=312471 RepID=A0A7S1R2A3_NEODS|mmetsp:Transcript_7230/g.22644  ORF Transcript_7230/g.22644 Transcript_7230/m.22644 type:complete len:747 (+) Transcript_7230:88-2328(+)|eukprot:CAMPEP_0174855184 /NCGR_PEP_ID=MMETSP1114-20130205/32628_1 /TAXON_ID=312471 /ORGANISM="Neobodo designis, Strain CCAP 1951/1" /LENGTH=746 /DNA_ID=CAMNT_0016089911 /DNA_START=83 /DNA_END=2323 /DNA_ORIENTATION=+